MRRTQEWLNTRVKEGQAEVVVEGRNWAEVRFFHHRTGKLVQTTTVFLTNK